VSSWIREYALTASRHVVQEIKGRVTTFTLQIQGIEYGVCICVHLSSLQIVITWQRTAPDTSIRVKGRRSNALSGIELQLLKALRSNAIGSCWTWPQTLLFVSRQRGTRIKVCLHWVISHGVHLLQLQFRFCLACTVSYALPAATREGFMTNTFRHDA
jgi:hypothetical protein